MNTRWLELLAEFFQTHGDALGKVLAAASCRENWLHGELFRWFRFRQGLDTFRVDSLPISDSQKADFSAEEPLGVVGEIKLLGWDYQTKGITGGSIKPFLERIDQPITAADRDMVLGPWGLIPDFFRLIDFAGNAQREAFLVLVVDERSGKDEDQSLARALRGINFVSPSRDVRFTAGVVRLWSVQAVDLG